MPIISRNRSLIPACDFDLETYKDILEGTKDNEKVGAYKIGFELGLSIGLPSVVELTREYSSKPIIYDHQKAATDIPDTGKKFAKTVRSAGIDAVILFPLSGMRVLESWVKASQDEGLGVIVGGEMTHNGFARGEGGYLTEDDMNGIYIIAAEMGVEDFVVPGTKPFSIRRIRKIVEERVPNPSFYSLGFITQGGKISEAALAAGKNFHAIVGRGLFQNGKGPIIIEKNVNELTKDF